MSKIALVKLNKADFPKKTCTRCNGCGLENDYVAFGEQMAKKRQNAGLTLKQVSSRLRYSISYISDLEHGRKAWSEEMIANYLRSLQKVEIG